MDRSFAEVIIAAKNKIINKFAEHFFESIVIVGIAILFLNIFIVKPIVKNYNRNKFITLYFEELQVVLDEYELELKEVVYSELVPDKVLDVWPADRINEYEIKVYLNESAPSYSKIYEILREVSYDTNDYLLSNTYKLLPDSENYNDDSKETGFHSVVTVFVFENNSSYRLRYATTLDKDGEIVWKWEKKSSGVQDSEETSKSRNTCSEPGCYQSIMPHLSYCSRHNCAYPGCGAPKYRYADSDYCKTHYVHQLQDALK